MRERLRVRVVFAAPSAQHARDIEIEAGATVAEAIRHSGIVEAAGLGESDLRHVGIFGRSVAPGAVLRDGDRVEIYRELLVDPKEARRRRARSTK